MVLAYTSFSTFWLPDQREYRFSDLGRAKILIVAKSFRSKYVAEHYGSKKHISQQA